MSEPSTDVVSAVMAATMSRLKADRDDAEIRVERAENRIAELEALTQPFTQSELARAEGVLRFQLMSREGSWGFEAHQAWLRSTVQAVAKALVEDRE